MRYLLLVLFLLGSSFAGPAVTRVASATPSVEGGAQAPDFSLPTDNGTVSLQSLAGKVVLVDFWATWCGPCQRSFPWLRAMHERYAAAGLDIVAINLDKDHQAAERFLDKYPAPFTVAFDPAAVTAKEFGVPGMPTTVLIGADGKILYVHTGFDPKKTGELEAIIGEACGS